MNPIQKMWLRSFTPAMNFFNEKIATRGGLTGRIAKFYKFGARENGAHPTTKLFRLLNHMILTVFQRLLQSQAVARSWS